MNSEASRNGGFRRSAHIAASHCARRHQGLLSSNGVGTGGEAEVQQRYEAAMQRAGELGDGHQNALEGISLDVARAVRHGLACELPLRHRHIAETARAKGRGCPNSFPLRRAKTRRRRPGGGRGAKRRVKSEGNGELRGSRQRQRFPFGMTLNGPPCARPLAPPPPPRGARHGNSNINRGPPGSTTRMSPSAWASV